jgi:hypothetical protein
LKKQSASDIVGGAKHTLSLAVLWRCVGTGHAKRDAIGKKESARVRVVKLAAIVTLHSFDGATKLRAHIGKEIGESRKSIGL